MLNKIITMGVAVFILTIGAFAGNGGNGGDANGPGTQGTSGARGGPGQCVHYAPCCSACVIDVPNNLYTLQLE